MTTLSHHAWEGFLWTKLWMSKKWTLNHRLGVGKRGSEIVSMWCVHQVPPKEKPTWVEVGCPSPFGSREAFVYTVFLVERKTLHFLELVDVLVGGILAIFWKSHFFFCQASSPQASAMSSRLWWNTRYVSLSLSLSNWVFLFTAANEMLIELKGLPKGCFNWEIGVY